jgi:hypothetical protein
MNHPFNEDIQAVLDSDEAYDYLPQGTWMSGGCVMLAEALNRLIPGSQLKVIGRAAVPDHVVVELEEDGERYYLDYDGLQTEGELVEKMLAEVQGEPVVLRAYDSSIIEEWEMDWQQDDLPGFQNFLERQLGAIDPERVSLAWLEEPSGPAPT